MQRETSFDTKADKKPDALTSFVSKIQFDALLVTNKPDSEELCCKTPLPQENNSNGLKDNIPTELFGVVESGSRRELKH